jgi:carboxymethylenebutenolidase
MDRTDASQFSQEVLDLFDRYVHGLLDRRVFLEQAGKLAPDGVTAAGLLEALSPRFAEAQQVAPDDTRLVTEFVEYEAPLGSGKVRAYSARPAAAKGPLPAVLVVHENRGLNLHIADVTRRLALEGFLALAPDALSPVGGYPGDEDKAREVFAKLDQAKAREDFVAAVAFLKGSPRGTGRVGAIGFCYGGGIVSMLATRVPDLAAAVPFYGLQPKDEDVARIHAPLLIHYAEHDERINAGIAAFERALRASKVAYLLYTYPGTQHGFNNDTTPRYDPAAAALAWRRTVEFLTSYVRA